MAIASTELNDRFDQKQRPKPERHDGSTLEMKVGERIHLELLTSGERIWGELVGSKQGKFLLVYLPSIAKYSKSLKAETMVAVRALNKDYHLCGFRTTISRLLTAPHPILLLDYPPHYEKLSLRQHERVNCLFPAILLCNGNEYKAMITNISEGGARVAFDCDETCPLETNEHEEVFLLFKDLQGNKEAVVRGEVRNQNRFETKLQLGVQFDNLIGDSSQIIQEYVEDVKRYNIMQ